ncbi:MAG: response regulator [Candidatus Hydrogenedentes bacterium]|nr:response regulator [Candidatus Hydrogenedentota bacterium]
MRFTIVLTLKGTKPSSHDIESEAGGGSTFWFTAVFDEPPEFQRVKHRATQAALREKRVLIVDDIETNRQILCEYFTLWGCRHEAVSGGAEALAILEQAVEQGDPFQLAVFDMMMPDMNGEELGRAIKNDPLLATIQLILYTSRARRGDAEQMRDAGFDAYLIKPVTRSQLLDCLLLICGVEEGSKRLVTRHTLQEEVTQLRLNRSKIRILLAEDNITNQVVTDAILTKLGYHADFVANGREAVETLKETSYDLVLMDCQMPDVDGYAATRAIRSMEGESRHTPVIALTAGAMKGDRERCRDAGMDDYVAKPLDSTILAEVLDRWAGLGTGDTTPAAIRDADVFAREQVLDRFAGDEELLNEILKTFLEDVPQQIDALRETVNTGDATVYERNGHLLEGAASAVGALKIQRLGRQMELAGRNEDLSGAARAIEDVIKAFEEFRVIANGNTQGLGDAGEQSDSAT